MAVTTNLKCDKCGKTYQRKYAHTNHIEKCTKKTSPVPLIREDSHNRALDIDMDVLDNVPIELYNMCDDEETNFFPTAFEELIGFNESDVSTYAIYPNIEIDNKENESEDIIELLTTAQKFTQKYLNPTPVTIAITGLHRGGHIPGEEPRDLTGPLCLSKDPCTPRGRLGDCSQ